MKSRSRTGNAGGRVAYWLGGLAAFGIVAAHCLAYILVAPDSHQRQMLMDTTGHRFWGLVFAVGLGAGVAGLSGALVRLMVPPAARYRRGKRLNLFAFSAPRLIALQLGGFVLLEATERTFTGGGAHATVEPVVVVGLALQVAVALVSALILCLLTVTLQTLLSGASLSSRKSARRLPRFALTKWLQPTVVPGTGAGTLRGPPLRA
jgi:hypothetical protein